MTDVSLEDNPYNISLMALSAALKAEGHEVLLWTAWEDDIDTVEYQRYIRSSAPDLLAYSAMSGTWPGIRQLATAARQATTVPIIVGGVHPTLFPREVIAHQCVDAVCVGPGEAVLLRVLESVCDQGFPPHIPRLWIKEDIAGQGSDRPPRVDIPDVATSRRLTQRWDYELFEPDRLRSLHPAFFQADGASYALPVRATTGMCPYNCHFCANQRLRVDLWQDRTLHLRPVEELIDELEYLKERCMPLRFKFFDEYIDPSTEWLRQFADNMQDRVGIGFDFMHRVDRVSAEKMREWKRAGAVGITFGMECGDEAFRREKLNKPLSDAALERACGIVREAGIQFGVFVMLGLPHETPEQVEKTFAMVEGLKPDQVMWNWFFPIPGTRLHDVCVEDDLLIPENADRNDWWQGPNIRLPDWPDGFGEEIVARTRESRWQTPSAPFADQGRSRSQDAAEPSSEDLDYESVEQRRLVTLLRRLDAHPRRPLGSYRVSEIGLERGGCRFEMRGEGERLSLHILPASGARQALVRTSRWALSHGIETPVKTESQRRAISSLVHYLKIYEGKPIEETGNR